jgi:hypothetical protein
MVRRRALSLAVGAAAATLFFDQRAAAQATSIWNGGAGNWNTPGNWSTGIVPNSGTTSVFIDNGNVINSTVTLDISPTVNDFALDSGDTLQFNTGQGFYINGNATVNGSLNLWDSTSGFGYLYFQGTNNQTLGGNGTVWLGTGAGANSILYNLGGASAKLTIGSGILIHGTGVIRDNSSNDGGILNQGSITADIPGQILQIDGYSFTNAAGANLLATNGGILNLGAANTTWHNAGTITAYNGTVNLGGTFLASDVVGFARGGSTSAVNLTGTLNNTGAAFALNANTGTWVMRGGTILGGTVTASGGALLQADNAGTLDGVNLAANMQFLSNGSTLYVYDGLTLNGATIDLSGGTNGAVNQYGNIYFQGTNSQTLGGTGTVLLGTNGANSFLYNSEGASAKVTLGPGILVHGIGDVRDKNSNDGGIVNQGTIAADVPGQPLQIDGYSFTNAAGANLLATNGGILNLGAANTVWHNAGTITAYNGTINLGGTFLASDVVGFARGGSSAVNLTGTLNGTGTTLALNANTGTWVMRGGTILGGTVTASGGALLQVGNAGTLDGVTLAANMQFLTNGSTLYVYDGLTLNGATIDLSGGTNGVVNQYGYIYFQGTNSQTLGGTGTILLGTNNASLLYNFGGASAKLTIGSGILIHGVGYVRDNNAADGGILNQGTIAADVFGQILQIDGNSFTNAAGASLLATNGGTLNLGGGAAAWHNAGTITAYNGTVNLGGTFFAADVGGFSRGGNSAINLTGTLNNTGATLALNASTGSWAMRGGTIVGGTVSASGGALLQIGNAGTLDGVTLLNTSTQFLTYDSGLNVYDGLTLKNSSLDLSGGTNGAVNQYGNIYFAGTNAQTLSGNGSVLLGTNGANSILYNYGSGTSSPQLTLGPDILIHGVGYVRDNAIADAGIVNQGTIAADVPGQILQIDGFSFTNAAGASLLATNGGILNLYPTAWHNAGTVTAFNGTVNLGGTFLTSDTGGFARGGTSAVNLVGTLKNSGATFTLDNNTGSWAMRNGTIVGGTVSASGAALLQIDNAGSLDGVTLLNTNTQFLSYASGLFVYDGLTLKNSILDLSGGTNGAANQYGYIYFAGTNAQTLSGNGSVLLGTNGANSILYNYGSGTNAPQLTLGPGILIHGVGYVRDKSIADAGIVNQGTIAADVPGQILQIDGFSFTNAAGASLLATNGGTLNLGGGATAWHNAGTITAYNGTVNLGGGFFTSDVGAFARGGNSVVNLTGTLTNTGSILSLNASTGSWNLQGGGAIRGGTVTTSGGAKLFIGSNANLDGVTLDAGTMAFNQNGASAYILNGLTLANGAQLDLANGTNGFYGTLYVTATSGQTLAGNGQINFGSNASNTNLYNYLSTNVLNIGSGVVIRGKFAQFIPYFLTDGGFVNQGTISADIAGGVFNFYGTFTNTGTVQGINGGNLSLLTTRFIQESGTLRSGGDVPNPNLLQINGGSAALGSLSGLSGTTILGNVAAGPIVPMTVGSISQNTLTIHNTGVLTVPMTTNRVTSTVSNVSMDGNGTFDLGNNELVTNTAPSVIRGYLVHAYDPNGNADWGQPGLTSSFAKNNPTNYSVGYAFGGDASAQDADVRQHNGAGLGTNQTIVRPVLTGDTNMDGRVDFFDISQLLGYKYNTGQAASYTDGDLDYSGKVDFFDIVLLLSANYNTGVKFGPAGVAAPTLSGAPHAASTSSAVASATTIGVIGDGKPDFEYDPATGHLRFRADGGTFTTTGGTASFVSSLTISSTNGILLSGGASAAFANGVGATLTSTLMSSALTQSPGFGDGFDIGIVLAPGLDAATLTADLTVKYQTLNGGSLKSADVTFIPEPAGLGLLLLGGCVLLARRRR